MITASINQHISWGGGKYQLPCVLFLIKIFFGIEQKSISFFLFIKTNQSTHKYLVKQGYIDQGIYCSENAKWICHPKTKKAKQLLKIKSLTKKGNENIFLKIL